MVCEVLKEEGFSCVNSECFEVDPTYTGSIDLQAYINLHDYKVILAHK